MAKRGRKTRPGAKELANLRPYKKGQSGNPSGINEPKELRQVRMLTKKELAEVGNVIIHHNLDTLKNMPDDPTTSVLQAMVAAVAARVIQKGDMNALDLLLNRIVGKVREEVKHSGEIINPHPETRVVVMLPSNGREVKAG